MPKREKRSQPSSEKIHSPSAPHVLFHRELSPEKPETSCFLLSRTGKCGRSDRKVLPFPPGSSSTLDREVHLTRPGSARIKRRHHARPVDKPYTTPPHPPQQPVEASPGARNDLEVRFRNLLLLINLAHNPPISASTISGPSSSDREVLSPRLPAPQSGGHRHPCANSQPPGRPLWRTL